MVAEATFTPEEIASLQRSYPNEFFSQQNLNQMLQVAAQINRTRQENSPLPPQWFLWVARILSPIIKSKWYD